MELQRLNSIRKQEWSEEFEKQKKEHINNIPDLSKYWKARGREIIDKSKWESWDQIVDIRLDDIYQGAELKECLDIVELLDNGGTLDAAKELIFNQCHSGRSFNLVCSIVQKFSLRGQEFVSFIR